MPDDPREYAAVLYERLHEADAEGWDWIAIEQPPRAKNGRRFAIAWNEPRLPNRDLTEPDSGRGDRTATVREPEFRLQRARFSLRNRPKASNPWRRAVCGSACW